MKTSTFWLYVLCGIPVLVAVTAIGPHLILSISDPKPGYIYVPTAQGWFSAFGFYILVCVWLFYATKEDSDEQARRQLKHTKAEVARRQEVAKAENSSDQVTAKEHFSAEEKRLEQEFIRKTGLDPADAVHYLWLRQTVTSVPTCVYLRHYLYGQPLPASYTPPYMTPEMYKAVREGDKQCDEKRGQSNNSVVYFIGNRAEGLVKIGYTTSLDKRLKTIQTSSPFPVSLFHAEPGTPDDERALHQRFVHLRKTGEWFRLEQPIVEYIQNQR